MLSPNQIVAKFEAVDAHDDTVEGISFHPPAKRGGKSSVTVTLFRPWENTRRLVTFTDCANIETIVDSDVLKDNAPNNTCSFEARADAAEIEALMRRQKKSWNVSYEKSIDPLPKKLTKAPNLVLFRIRLFGGSIVIVAKSFSIKRLILQSRGQTTAGQA